MKTTENRSDEDVADANTDYRIDEVLTSEDVDDESEDHRIDTKDKRETHYIYVEAGDPVMLSNIQIIHRLLSARYTKGYTYYRR